MSKALVPFNALESGQSLQQMILFAESQPVLSAGEELALATRFCEQNSLQAAQQLVLSHLRFVIRVAKGYSGYGLCLTDLIQEGTIGLMKAVKKFQPAKAVRLVTYAMHWIKAEIHDYILKNWRIVKVATTKAQKKLFFNLRRLKKDFHWLNQNEIAEIAKDLDVPTKEVERMEQRLAARDASFDLPDGDEEKDMHAPVQYLGTAELNPERLLTHSEHQDNNQCQLEQALAQMDARSRDILTQRWLAEKKSTLEALAEKYKVSKERIRQIEQKAMQFLRNTLEQPIED